MSVTQWGLGTDCCHPVPVTVAGLNGWLQFSRIPCRELSSSRVAAGLQHPFGRRWVRSFEIVSFFSFCFVPS